jgi:hypothetical protein
MKTLHNTLLGIGLVAVFAIAVVSIQPLIAVAEAQHTPTAEARDSRPAAAQHPHDGDGQHGQASEAAEHFHALVDQLALSEQQQHALAEPFQEAFAAMQKLHRLHDVIAEELTSEQREKLAAMIHEMLGASFREQMQGDDAPHGGHH